MRKLVTIREIDSVQSIEGADNIETIILGGWSVVTQKSNNLKAGDKVVYFEVDSVIPYDSIAGKTLPQHLVARVHTEDGYIDEAIRIRTIKLRGQLSQGYALPLSVFPDEITKINPEDLTKHLNVSKYEKPYTGNPLSANPQGNFPTEYFPKTDQERVQNLVNEVYREYLKGTFFEISVKLDGSSLSIANDILVSQSNQETGNQEFVYKDFICSRNLSLKLDQDSDTSLFLKVGKPILELIKAFGTDYSGLVFQGELVAPSIQGNFEGVSKPEYYVYNVYNTRQQEYLKPCDTEKLCKRVGLNHVPILLNTTLEELFGEGLDKYTLLQHILSYADGESGLKGKYREGVVFKSQESSFSFKAISNKYLLKEK